MPFASRKGILVATTGASDWIWQGSKAMEFVCAKGICVQESSCGLVVESSKSLMQLPIPA